MKEKMWFYSIDGQERGPINIEKLKNLIEQGIITDQTLVWNKSFKKFTKVSEVDNADIKKALDYIKDKPKNPETISAMYMGVSILVLLLLIVGIKLSALVGTDSSDLAEADAVEGPANTLYRDEEIYNGLENIELLYGIETDERELVKAKAAPFENSIEFKEMTEEERNTRSIAPYEDEASLISSEAPESRLILSFKNTQGWMPKNPALVFDFNNIVMREISDFMSNYDENIKALNYREDRDYYTKFKWILGEENILYKEEALTVDKIPFGGSELIDEASQMKVSLVDGEGNRVDYVFNIELMR